MKNCLLYIFCFVLGFSAYGQLEQEPVIPATFLARVQGDLAKIGSDKSEAVSLFFQKYWQEEGVYSAGEKKKIEALYDSLTIKGLPIRDFRLPFIGTISGAAANLENPTVAVRSFLTIVEKGLAELTDKELQVLLKSTESILEKKALYHSKYYQLAFKKGSVTFDWIETETIPDIEEEIEEEEPSGTDDWGSTEEETDPWGSTDSWEEDNSSWDSQEEDVADESQPVSEQPFLAYKTPLPELSGPIVKLKDIDLTFLSSSDSARIINTSGSLELLGNTFVAEGGEFTWEHLGIDKKDLFAELPEYTLEVNKPNVIVEGAILHYPEKVRQAVKGLLEYQTERRSRDRPAQFPFFQSYESGLDLNIVKVEGLYVSGGITLRGTTITTASLDNGFSRLELQGKAVKKFSVKSREFIYKDSAFTSSVSNLSIYQRKDSVYHPGVSINYSVKENKLKVLQGKGGFKKSPFHASYFNIDFYADKIEWALDSSVLDISILIAGNRVPAMFESSEYYNEYRYNSLAGLYNFHPLQLVVSYGRKAKQKTFYLNDVADRMDIDQKSLGGAMQLLMENGFLIFDNVSGRIDLLDKAFHYVDSKWGRKDFDNVKISSISSGIPNGKLDLDKGTLTVRGVENFEINEKLGVSVKPDSGIVVLKKNRDVQFNGTVYAGNYEYVGAEFEMDYDSFLISMPQIDRIQFNLAKDAKKVKQSDKEKLQNQLVETAGVLYINKPDNKSATKEYPSYPIFNATKGATVYFLGEEILDGVYDKSLYFIIPPFTIDSVSSSDPNSIAFEGTFHSGGIFPEFSEKLRVMPDKSLGFNHPLPVEGIDLLEGTARFYGNLKLDNQGLRGGDKIEFLSTTINSPNFTFFKDSINAVGTYAKMESGDWEGTSFPDMEIVNFDMRWLTSKDSLYLSNKSEPFKMYNETASLSGRTVISQRGLYGEGKLATRGSKTNSNHYTFKELGFAARNADFIIESNDTIPALASDNVKLNFDFSKNVANINPEVEGDAALNFPYASYKTSIPSAEWKLDEKLVMMKKPQDVPIKNSYFYSTNPDQDSLVFNATEAVYDIDDLSLIVSGIPHIQVADALITPGGGKVTIGENATMNKLYEATLTLDTLTAYHNLYDGEIDIISRNKFEGDATYRYVNSIGDTFSIKMGKFTLEPAPVTKKGIEKLRTVSSGKVVVDDRMLISPGMYYKGDITMYADKPALNLEGYVQLDLKNIPNYDTWIRYKSDGSAKEVVFDFDESVTEMGNPLQAGIHFDSETSELYATFINDKRDPSDQDFFKPSGLLAYQASTDQFKIENKEKSIGNSYSGKYFAFNEQEQKIEFEGPLNFINGRKEAEFRSAGSGSGDLLQQEFLFNIMLTAEFDLPKSLTPVMGNDMLEVVGRLGLPEATKDLDRLLPKLAELAGDQTARKYEEGIFNDYIPLHTMSSALTKTLNITSLDLKWSTENSAWYNVGKIGFSNTGATDVNANIDGFVEIDKKEMGTSIRIFLQVSPSCWYFFHYEEDRLIFFSSNPVANDIIDKKSKATKAKIGEFVFLTGDKLEVTNFVEEYRRKYYDIDAPYFLEMATEGNVSSSGPTGSDPLPPPTTPTTPEETDDDDGF
ncbi:hypothetical protein JKA74_13160 [Marivirga sp. S37H4]|uniref:Uncharacterized protein n=1 Tax=Marivirga aurantiaca TaxID=2802615 RepID=A0A934X078_9BACT|nr:hypothetical protein [Marivirga aurantiaca]MBK6265985.1 hypothetical protein [Marivirga aurantiaca]